MAFDEIQNLIINVTGRDDVQQLREAIAQEEAALVKAAAAHGHFSSAAKASAQTIQVLQADLKKMEALVNSTGLGMKGYGQAALTASYAFQDFTSVQGSFTQKLASIQNNLPGLIMSLGGPGMAGLAGAISIVSVGAGLAIPVVADLATKYELIGTKAKESIDHIGKLEDRIKALEKQPVKLGVDLLELEQAHKQLEQLKRDQAAFNALKDGKTVFEAEAGQQARANYDVMGRAGEKAKEDVAARMTGEMNAASPGLNGITAARGAVSDAQGRLAGATDAASRRQAQDQLNMAQTKLQEMLDAAPKIRNANRATAEQRTGAMFSGTFAGNDANSRKELIKRLRGVGSDEANQLANALEASTPEEMEAQNDNDNANQASDDKWFGVGGGKQKRRERQQMERRAEISAVEERNKARDRQERAGGPVLPGDMVRVFGPGGRPGGRGGAGGGVGGGAAEVEGGFIGAPGGGQAVRPKGTADRIAANAKRLREQREAKLFRARQRNAAKKRGRAAPGVFAAAGPPRAIQQAAKPAAEVVKGHQQAQLNALQMDNLILRAELERSIGQFGQASRALQRLQAEANARARNAQQDGDSFLPNRR